MRARERGSILEFVIVGAVMALLLIGGVYAIRHMLAPSAQGTDSTTSESDADLAPSSDETPDVDDTKEDDSTVQNSEDDATTDETTESESSTSETAAEDGQTPSDLPQTGPAQSLLAGFLLSSMVAVAIAYKRSRDLFSSL